MQVNTIRNNKNPINCENGTIHITINEAQLAQNIKLLSAKSDEQLNEIKEITGNN